MANKLSIKEKIALKSKVILNILGLSIQKTKEGENVAILQLAEPLPYVRSSQEVEVNGKKLPIEAYDVTEVKVHESNFNDDFQFEEDSDMGTYEGSSLMLDVTKQGQVWLVEKSFASSGQEMRSKFRTDRLQTMIEKQTAARQARGENPKVVPVETTN